MLFKLPVEAAREWALDAQITNLTYYRTRRELHDRFVILIREAAHQSAAECVTICTEQMIVIRHFLTSRNENLDDNKRLAFDHAVIDLMASASRELPRAGLARLILGPGPAAT